MAVNPAYPGAHEHARRELPDLEELEAALGIDFPDYAKGTGNGIFNPGEWPGSPRPLSF